MKNSKRMLGILVVLLAFPFSSNAMHGDFVEARREGDITETGPKKEEPKKGGILSGLLNLLSGKHGGKSTTGGQPTTGKTLTTGDRPTTSTQGTTVAGKLEGNNGMTARDAMAEETVGKSKNFARQSDSSAVQSTGKTVDQKEAIVDKSDLSPLQKAIVKSIIKGSGSNDAQLLIGAMKNVEMQIVDAMTGTKGSVVSDHNLTEVDFVKQLEVVKEGCLHRLETRKDDSVGREFDIEKLRITETLLSSHNAQVRSKFFYVDIEPKVRKKKLELRSRG